MWKKRAKRTSCFLIAALMLLSLLPVMASAEAGLNFTGDALALYTSGNTFSNKQIVIDYNSPDFLTGTIQMKLRVPTDNSRIGIIFRYKDVNNFASVYYDSGIWMIDSWKDGVEDYSSTLGTKTLNALEIYDIKITVTSTSLSLMVDGVTVGITSRVSYMPTTAGPVGIMKSTFVSTTHEIAIDDLRVAPDGNPMIYNNPYDAYTSLAGWNDNRNKPVLVSATRRTYTPVEPEPEQEEGEAYYRYYDERDTVTTNNWTVFNGSAPSLNVSSSGGQLSLKNFAAARVMDKDSSVIKNGTYTIKFKSSGAVGRIAFVFRAVDASTFSEIYYDTGTSWGWQVGNQYSSAFSGPAIVKDRWYTVRIRYVGKDVKIWLTDDQGVTTVVGSATIDIPEKAGKIGLRCWFDTKNITVEELSVVPYKESGPSVIVPYESYTIQSDDMAVVMDNRYPTPNSYTMKTGANTGKTMQAQSPDEYLYKVAVNGDRYEAKVLGLTKTADTATYTMEVDALKDPDFPTMGTYGLLRFQTDFKVVGNTLEQHTKILSEPAGFVVRTFGYIGQKFASARYSSSNTQVSAAGMATTGAWNSIQDYFFDVKKMVLTKSADAAPFEYSAEGDIPLAYAFVSDGTFSAAVINNIVYTPSKNIINTTPPTGAPSDRVVSLRSGAWDYRGNEVNIDNEYENTNFPALEDMWSTVVISGDVNSDGVADWQDGAVGYRRHMPVPMGGQDIKNNISYIMMNAGSEVQSSFAQSLDAAKRLNNLYDGFGQMQLQKGYQGEGHDDAHNDAGGHIGIRQGGVQGFRDLIEGAKKYNTKIGVHVNINEMMLDAFYPKFERFIGASSGNLSANWGWYDQAYFTDDMRDLLSGELKTRFDMLKDDTTIEGDTQSSLGWVYVDIYAKANWHSKQVADMFHKNGWILATEFSGPFEQDAVWTHWGTDYHYPTSGNGSKIHRFLKNDTADIFPANSPYVSTLFKGVQQPSISGWQNTYSFTEATTLFYNENLVSKYMQYFPILSWSANNTKAVMENGVVSQVTGNKLYVSRNGKNVAICDIGKTSDGKLNVTANSLIFIPWDPINESKIYHWNPVGGNSTWTMPDSWSAVTSVDIYQLTDNGRVFIRNQEVTGGSITINASRNIPYILEKAGENHSASDSANNWTQMLPVKDSGFDYQKFYDQDSTASWKRTTNGDINLITYVRDNNSNNILQIGKDDAVISQDVTGLTPGKDYSISTWVQVNAGPRKVTFGVKDLSTGPVTSWLDKTPFINPNQGIKFRYTTFRRMKVTFTADETGKATVFFEVPAGVAGSSVRIDDVRVWEHPTKTALPANTYTNIYQYYDDFENVDMYFGPFEFVTNGSDRTVLVDQHPDFNKGANQYMSYVINGNYSMITHEDDTPVNSDLLRTYPSVLRFQPNTNYEVGFKYYTPVNGTYRVTVKDGAGAIVAQKNLTKTGEPYALGENGKQTDPAKRKPSGTDFSIKFTTTNDTEYYVAITKVGAISSIIRDYLIIDDFYSAVVLDKSALEAAAAEFESLLPTEALYVATVFADARTAYDAAVEALASATTQVQIDEATANLENALSALVKKGTVLKTGTANIISVKRGRTFTLPYVTNAYGEITFTSSNKAVATVEDGVITGVKAGMTLVTLRATDGSGLTAQVTVTVVS